MGEKTQIAKERGSEKAEDTCFLAEVRLTSIMWGPPTLLPVHGINEDAGMIGRFLMQKTFSFIILLRFHRLFHRF